MIDCHSMPTRRGQAAIVVGDRHGSSAASWVTAETARIAREAGFHVALNEPYAGGAIIAKHGAPAQRVHAVQLEIDRSLYLKNDGRTPGVGFDRIARLIEAIAIGLGNSLLDRNFRQAAE
jgi:N-formylglutamate amidohydrolase